MWLRTKSSSKNIFLFTVSCILFGTVMYVSNVRSSFSNALNDLAEVNNYNRKSRIKTLMQKHKQTSELSEDMFIYQPEHHLENEFPEHIFDVHPHDTDFTEEPEKEVTFERPGNSDMYDVRLVWPPEPDETIDVDVELLTSRVAENKSCTEVVSDPITLWRDSNPKSNCEDDFSRMNDIISCGGPLDAKYLHTPPAPMYRFESFFLSEPRTKKISNVTSVMHTDIVLVSQRKTFTVGQVAVVRVDTRDQKGRKKTKGGDEIRAYLTENIEEGKSQAIVTAKVTDLNNGSYIVKILFPWAGEPTLHIGLVYPREYLRAQIQLLRTLKATIRTAAKFNNSKGDEATVCYHKPLLPGYTPREMCNLTVLNGAPWFCGKPQRFGLKCSDYSGSRNMAWPSKTVLPLTKAEFEILNQTNSGPRIYKFHHGIHFKVNKGTEIKPKKLLDCSQVPARKTWDLETPTGYFPSYKLLSRNHTWNSLVCNQVWNYTCFQDTTMIFIGDSNSRTHYRRVREFTNSTELTNEDPNVEAWHKPLRCLNKTIKFKAMWDPHEHPFHVNNDAWSPVWDLSPSAKIIDSVPSEGRYIIVFNHYVHTTRAHLSALHTIMRNMADALKRLFARNKDVHVLIMAPHTALTGWHIHYVAGDYFRHQIEAIHHEVFRDLKDRIVYLKLSDMTIGSESRGFHPKFQRTISDVILSYMCHRQ